MSQHKYSFEEAWNLYRKDPSVFFEEILNERFNDRELIEPSWSQLQTTYHYNLIENAIIDIIIKQKPDHKALSVLDIGVGTGHWVEFYRSVIECSHITGIDFARSSIERLKDRYNNDPRVAFVYGDISSSQLEWIGQFDIINAIGVIFHIVEDDKWERAVQNIVGLCQSQSIVIVGGGFGQQEESRGIMRKFRSRSKWENLLDTLRCKIIELKYFDWFSGYTRGGIADNILIFKKDL